MTARILYVSDSLMAGGIESQLVELATRLDRARFTPTLLSLYGPRARDLHYASTLERAGVPVIAPDLLWGVFDKLRGVDAIVTAVQRLHPHIVQAEGYHANLLTRLARPFLPETTLLGTVRGVHSTKQLCYERWSHRVCQRLIVNAPQLKTMLIEGAGVPPGKIDDIPNGVDLARYATPTQPGMRQSLAHSARRVFVSIGRVSWEKNLHWIAQASGLLRSQGCLPDGVRLLLVGPIQHEDAQQALRQAIEADALDDVIEQRPSTPEPQDYYAAADATILFSPNEGLPNVALESLAAGRPVIISAAANQAGVIEDGVTGWVVPTGDIEQLAATLRHIIALPNGKLAHMRIAAATRARDYSMERMVERYTCLYDRLLGGNC